MSLFRERVRPAATGRTRTLTCADALAAAVEAFSLAEQRNQPLQALIDAMEEKAFEYRRARGEERA